MSNHDPLIARGALFRLLLAQFFVLAPHVLTAPLWIPLVWLLVVFWRWKIYRNQWRYPGRWAKFLVLALCCTGLLISSGGKPGMTGMVSLLLTGFILKLLEMKHLRDGVLVCFLGYLVVATQFLFYSSMGAALYGFFCVLLLTGSLLLLSATTQGQEVKIPIGRLLWLPFTQAVVLMMLLFVMLPRFGPLWAVPVDNRQAKTGISDSLSPGSFSSLLRSSQPAFRVSFDGPAPEVSAMYWRALVFSRFDGKTWSPAYSPVEWGRLRPTPQAAGEYLSAVSARRQPLSYRIILEPTRQNWLFSLGAPSEWSTGVMMAPDLTLRWRRPVDQRIQYQVESHLSYQWQSESLSALQRQQNLDYPASVNPRTLVGARQWRSQAASDEVYIARVLSYFRENFSYTLQPGVLGEHPVDEFLWDTRSGFCEHFASAFALMMRVAGIPARVVTGYQGGEANITEDYWLIRQRDAHAWVEIWLEGRGWVMLDPTAAVAPERIEQGIDYSLDDDERYLLGNNFARNNAFINYLRLRMDAMNYHWARWVLNYDRDRQNAFLDWWRQLLGSSFLPLVGAGLVVLAALLIVVRRVYRNAGKTRLQRLFGQFEKKMKRQGLVRSRGETVGQFVARIRAEKPELADRLAPFATLYERIEYAEETGLIEELTSLIRQL